MGFARAFLSKPRSWLAAFALIGLCLGPHVASAEDTGAQAREAYQKATAHYAVGEFAEAADLYQQAYKFRPDAALLYNAAQAYRLAGNHSKALLLYKNFVLMYPQARNIPEVKQQIAALQAVISSVGLAKAPASTSPSAPAAQGAAGPGTAAPTPTAAAPSTTTSTTPASTAASTAPSRPPVVASVTRPTGERPATTASEPAKTEPTTSWGTTLTTTAPKAESNKPHGTPAYKKWWVWVAVVGGVLVVGGVTAGAIAATTPRGPWSTGGDFGSGAMGLK